MIGKLMCLKLAVMLKQQRIDKIVNRDTPSWRGTTSPTVPPPNALLSLPPRRPVHATGGETVLIAACLQTHMSIITVSVTWFCSPLGLELMVKLRTFLTFFTFILKDEARNNGKGRYISDTACGVWLITMHCSSWPIRTDCACRKEGLLEN